MIQGIMPNKRDDVEEERRGTFWQHPINIWGSGDGIRFDDGMKGGDGFFLNLTSCLDIAGYKWLLVKSQQI